jgi:hypothetical protein
MIAPAAMWMIPFSGPSQRNCESRTNVSHTPRRSSSVPSRSRPTSVVPSDSIARHWISFPRPIVNAKPWPVRPPSVPIVTYAAE